MFDFCLYEILVYMLLNWLIIFGKKKSIEYNLVKHENLNQNFCGYAQLGIEKKMVVISAKYLIAPCHRSYTNGFHYWISFPLNVNTIIILLLRR